MYTSNSILKKLFFFQNYKFFVVKYILLHNFDAIIFFLSISFYLAHIITNLIDINISFHTQPLLPFFTFSNLKCIQYEQTESTHNIWCKYTNPKDPRKWHGWQWKSREQSAKILSINILPLNRKRKWSYCGRGAIQVIPVRAIGVEKSRNKYSWCL